MIRLPVCIDSSAAATVLQCALSVKTFHDKVELVLAGEHTTSSHSSSGILSVKKRSAVKRAVRSSPHSVGSQVQASLENFSPGKRILFVRRSQKAVARLVRSEWKEIMAERVPGIDLDNTEGAMTDSLIPSASSSCLRGTMIPQTIFTWMSIRLFRSATNSKMASPS